MYHRIAPLLAATILAGTGSASAVDLAEGADDFEKFHRITQARGDVDKDT